MRAPAALALALAGALLAREPGSGAIKVVIHKASAAWKPVGVKAGGEGQAGHNSFSFRRKKPSQAKSVARVYRQGEDKRLVVSVFPRALQSERVHVELRFLVIEGYLEKLEVAEVTAAEGAGPEDDAATLKAKGIAYQEEFPSAGALRISAIDARPGKGALNVGALTGAVFPKWLSESSAKPGLGRVDLRYSARGVAASGPWP